MDLDERLNAAGEDPWCVQVPSVNSQGSILMLGQLGRPYLLTMKIPSLETRPVEVRTAKSP